MKKLLLAATLSATALGTTVAADGHGMTVGVSWSNFQEERWKTDEAAIKGALEAAGAKYISADAQSSSAKQLSDVESLIAQGVDALIILAQDSAAIGPAVDAAAAEGIPVVGYDRLIEDSRAFYLTFDNVEVGRMQARAVFEAMPKGRYVMIKGSPTDPNADFLREILTANDNGVDAVVASNDGTAGGVVAALTAQGLEGMPVSGQDGDHAALNRVALGTQTVSVWKDARDLGKAAGEIAVELAGNGGDMKAVGDAIEWESPAGTKMTARFLAPVPVTAANLSAVVDAGWITKEALCQGVSGGPAPCN